MTQSFMKNKGWQSLILNLQGNNVSIFSVKCNCKSVLDEKKADHGLECILLVKGKISGRRYLFRSQTLSVVHTLQKEWSGDINF